MTEQPLRRIALPAGIEPEWVTVPHTQLVTGLGRKKVYELIADRTLESITVGKRRLVRLSSARSLGTQVA
jgi:hypothetical protein